MLRCLTLWKNLFGRLAEKKSGVFSLPFPPGGTKSRVAVLFAVNGVLNQCQSTNGTGAGVQREQRCSCSLLLLPSVYLYFFHIRMYILYSMCNICLSIVIYLHSIKCCIHGTVTVTSVSLQIKQCVFINDISFL